METTFTQWKRACVVLTFMVCSIMPEFVFGQVRMGTAGNTTYTQDFNSLPRTGTQAEIGTNAFIPDGWTVERSMTGNVLYVNNGSSNTGGLYSYGHTNATDRALGAISAAKPGEFTYNLLLQNTSGQPILALDVAYVAEQWRCGSINTDVQSLTFSYAIAANPASFDLSTKANAKGWTNVPSMQFNSPVFKSTAGHVNGNDPANRAHLSYTLPVAIPEEHYVMLRWRDADEPEQDHGLAIDDVSVTWHFAPEIIPLPVELMHFSARAVSKAIELAWATASEQNNSHFEIERSANAISFEQVGRVEGQGTTSLLTNYTFSDKKPLPNTSYYRLRQVDEDGTYTYSMVVAVRAEAPGTELLAYPTITSHELRVELPQQQASYLVSVYDKLGSRVLYLRLASDQTHSLQISHLREGSYVLVTDDEKGQKHTARFLKY